jgi:hypothetical protein
VEPPNPKVVFSEAMLMEAMPTEVMPTAATSGS